MCPGEVIADEKYLCDIIKDGTLVDNRSYTIADGILTPKAAQPNTTVKNIPTEENRIIWEFLNDVASQTASAKNTGRVVTFNHHEYVHNTNDPLIRLSGVDGGNFQLDTGNLVGFVTSGKHTLRIGSRFGEDFLRYIIADTDGFLELEDMGGSGEHDDQGSNWLLAYFWNIKFKRAYRLGVPKAYVTRRDRLSRVRGSIDVVDYYHHGASGKYLCRYREHSYDSPATSLFLKAYETIAAKYPFCAPTRKIYNAFLAASQGVKRSRQEILNTPFFSNPFYSDYNLVIDLSKRVIRQQSMENQSEQAENAFLFDVSMLFEYFIRKTLTRNGIDLHGKSGQTYRIPTGDAQKHGHKLIPDIVFEHNGGLYVFDVKYKNFSLEYGVRREDLFQLHTYIGQWGNDTPVSACGFIYPIAEHRAGQIASAGVPGLISSEITQQGRKIPFHILFLIIPDGNTDSPLPFTQRMKHQCDSFMRVVHDSILPAS